MHFWADKLKFRKKNIKNLYLLDIFMFVEQLHQSQNCEILLILNFLF